MSPLLFADAALVLRLERFRTGGHAAHARSCARLYPDLGAALEPVGEGFAVYEGPGSPLNRAVGLGLTEPVSAAQVDQVEAFFAQRGLPAMIDVSPLSHRSLWDLLGERGYRIHFFLNVLARPMAGVTEPRAASPEGVTVARVGPDEMDTWARVVCRGFGSDYTHPSIALISGSAEHVACYLARRNGEPAGGGALEVRDGVGGLMSTSVLPEYRNRGVQSALLRARLDALAAAGCDLLTVMTSPGSASQRNVHRFGFQVAYTKVVMIKG